MSADQLLLAVKSAVESLDFYEMRKALNNARAAGITGYDIVTKGILEGMKRSGEIGLILAAEALRADLAAMADSPGADRSGNRQQFSGRVLIGTVQGDIHDFGKNILAALLRSIGIEVDDLGVDVSPADFVAKVRTRDVKVVALSSLLSSGFDKIRQTIAALDEAGLRAKIKVIVGGAALSHEAASDIMADAYGEDAMKGLEIIRSWVISPSHGSEE